MDFSAPARANLRTRPLRATSRLKRSRAVGLLFYLACLLCTLPLCQAFKEGAGLYLVRGMKTVQYEGATLGVFAIPELAIPAGGELKLIAPSSIFVYTTGLTCYDVRNGRTCSVRASRNTFIITVDQDIGADGQFQYEIGNAINNPTSTKWSDKFELLSSTGELERDSEGLRIQAEQGRMAKYLLSPESQVVGASTSLKIEFSAQHDIPADAYIFIYFPKWNPSMGTEKPYIQGSAACAAVRILSDNLFCDFDNDLDRLKVQKAFAVKINSGTEMAFTVTGFKNPIEASLIDGFRIETAERFGAEFYTIDEDSTSLAVSQFAQLSNPKLKVLDESVVGAGMVQELNDMRLDFYLPVPLKVGCKIKIVLPEPYSVNTVQSLITSKAFGAIQTFSEANGNLRIVENENSLTLDSACQSYIENNKEAVIDIFSLRQPNYEKTTDSVRIYVTGANDSSIAMVEENVTFTPERGELTATTDAGIKIVQESTEVFVELTPEHILYLADQPEIFVEFPQEVEIQTVQCEIADVSDGSSLPIGAQCYRNQQTFQVKTFLGQDYDPATATQPIKFTLGKVKNPVSVQRVDGLKIVVFAFGKYAIDEFEGYIGWTMEQGDFVSAQVKPNKIVAYDSNVNYEISFTPTHMIPQNGYIVIEFPKQVSVPDYSYSQSSCLADTDSAFSNNQITCLFDDGPIISHPFRLRLPTTADHYKIRILNAFRRTSVPGKLEYKLTIPGLRNPIQTVPTFSFKFYTYDERHQLIDEKLSGVQIQMTRPAILDIALVTLGDYTNARVTDYTITMVPTVPVWETNLILITFPSGLAPQTQIKLPADPVALDCSTVFESLLADVQCSYDAAGSPFPHTVRVDLTFADNVLQIDPLDRFSIKINGIRNPTTTQTTDSIQVRITDQTYEPINSKLDGILVTTNNAVTIGKAFAKAVSPQPGVETDFILDFYPEHPISPGGGILVVYPPETLVGSSQTLSAKATVDGTVVDQDQLNVSYDLSARAVTISNLVQTSSAFVPDAAASKKITVTLTGLRAPYTSEETQSFQLTTYNQVDDRFFYFIDQVQNGLTINSKCNYPCADCDVSTPSECLACYPVSPDITAGRPFLQEKTCVDECAANRYFDVGTNRCELCDSKCLQCVDSATKCTKCGVGDYLYLFEQDNTCLTECPARFIEDPRKNRCRECHSNCLTCEGLATACTSCDATKPHKYFFHDSCIESCLPDISVLMNEQCIECDSTCKTCSGTPQTCTSCEPHMKLDPFKQTCEDLCAAEVQIYNPELRVCERCEPTCTKCAGTTDTCTECKPGYVLNFDQTCKPACSAPNQTAIDGVCQACEEPCFQCEGSVSTCKTCIPDYALYLGTKCVQYCPEKYETTDNVCVYEGLLCPGGFELNQSKDGCIPIKFDCDPGYIINDAKTACVPEPGSAVPFPFLLLALLICLLVLGSYLKDKQATKVLTNLIALIGSLEIIMYVMMVVYAYALGETVILILVLIGLFGLVAANILFVGYLKQQILLKDQVFVKWLHFFPKTSTWVPILSLLVNFKVGRMFYSGFYGLESTLARFGRANKFFYLLKISSGLACLSYLFIFIADLMILSWVAWGYQLSILAIETLVIGLAVLIMTYFELRKGANALLNTQGAEFAMIKPNKAGQVKVMGVAEDDDYDQGIPDIDEDTLIRSKIKTEQLEIGLRQQALSRILNQVGGHPTEKGVDLTDCMTKFDPERIKKRRCFSLSGIDSDESWVAEGPDPDEGSAALAADSRTPFGYGDLDRDEPRARRYSFPLSPPRQKNLPNAMVFETAIADIKEAQTTYLIDNVYTETKPVLDAFAKRKVKTVSRRTQTYLRELLQVEGEEVHESDMEVLMEEEAEIDFDFAKGLIDKVIDHISSADESGAPASQQKKKKPKKKVFKAKKEIPDFELADIMGDFEIDDMGNFIIMRGEGGELLDRRERLVNRRGYLIDRFGNVINAQGNIIFKAIELDVDDEIPAPFGFEKRKKNLLKLGDENQFKIESARDSRTEKQLGAGSQYNIGDDEDLLDKEITQIRERSRQTHLDKIATDRSATPDDDHITQPREPSMQKDASQAADQEVIDEEDNLEAEIDQLVKKKVPKKRKVLKGGKVNKIDNHPPKRIRPEDVNGLFPHLSIEHDEQKRLAKIASSISGLASQLADQQRQQQLIEDRKHSATYSAQPFDWDNLAEEQKLERIRQENLNEIMAGSELAATDKMGEPIYDRSFMLQDRPNTNVRSLNLGGLDMNRQMSAVNRPRDQMDTGMRRNPSQNRAIGNTRDRTGDLRKVYGQAVDLTGFEDGNHEMYTGQQSHLKTQEQENYRQKRGYSGRPGRVAGLETIYLTKIPKIKPPMNMNVSQSSNKKRNYSGSRPDHHPFRPTLDRFADDPSELNVDTTMHGSALQGGGKDILEIADKLDQMQRDYLTHKRTAPNATQKLPLTGQQEMVQHQPMLDDKSEGNFQGGGQMMSGMVTGHHSHYVQAQNDQYGHLQGVDGNDARTNSGGKRLAHDSDVYDSMERIKKDQWINDE